MTADGKMNASHIATGQHVLRLEGEALLTLAEAMPDDFSAAVDLILGLKGRVIVSGMGKSGHVGRKIAATLASTGTPAFFVHPAEASHGDLGMVTAQDLCIMISNSGETSELSDLIAHCVRFGVPIIGISKQPDSTLMRAATLRLTFPDLPEACSIGLAPTTSTTLSLGLGDALAISLMEARAFQPENFRTYHPGGKLGARLATAAQLMHAGDEVPLVREDTPMAEVILSMTSHGFGVAGVVDAQGALCGVISDGDLRRHMSTLMAQRAIDVATKNPIAIGPDKLAVDILATMNQYKISAIFVIDSAQAPIGIVHLHDCLRAGVA
ncbi:KpsF/GutQ family sugar-phosphate isomerase [Ketogulonicigenium vulgare]|uniref:KpsF/GutQ family sugar-phosphate isomerase n=1 Tax=Ketogulonicigenium vulgare TaxID=92945 RepID=UPI00235A3ACA|nr:KpsF/GutQ family sugar-phosphate isomerase [Ketogulonicigenium vulgare]